MATLPAGASANPSWPQQAAVSPAGTPDAIIPGDQLDSLVAPIALYPDPLLSQVLVASTYPLEIIQLQQWMAKNPGMTGKALTDAVMQQDWDPSIQAMATFPDQVKLLSENIKWTTDLGNAFLAQQNDVMDAVQRMRTKAMDKGALKSTEQQTVATQTVEGKTVVVVQPASTEVVYVPSYDPVAVWGEPYYPYPPMAYPYYPAGGALLGFGVGVAIGAAWGGGGWGWNCGWGGNNNININNNNNFINNNNLKNINNPNRSRQGAGGSGTQWQHNPEHRGGTPYSNRDTANRFGGTTRGDSAANRQAAAQRNQGQFGNRQQGGLRDTGASNLGGNRPGAGTGSFGGAGGDRIGSRDVSRGSGSGAFGGASSGMNDRSARASQSRGASSMGSRGSSGFSGGGRRSGGGGGGGGRRR